MREKRTILMLREVTIIAVLICGTVLPTLAAEIAIANAGFEQVVLPCAPVRECNSLNNVAGWTGTTYFFTFKPSTGPGGIFPGGIPEGVNVAALGIPEFSGNSSIDQTLNATLQPNTTYTLVFRVGAGADVVFSGYRVELLAGSTTLESDSSLVPSSGAFVTGRIVYSSSARPALLGQKLGIRLSGAPWGQACFDKISLEATPTVVTSTASQVASGGNWKTTLTIISFSSAEQSIKVAFRGDDGLPLTLPLVVTQQGVSQPETSSSVTRTVGPGGTLLIESEAPASSPVLVGSGEVISSGLVGGFAIFRQRGQDGRDSEGTAPLEATEASSLVLPFDNMAGFWTGVALVNWGDEAAIISATIRDDSGAQFDLQALTLSALAHTSFIVADRWKTTNGRRGIIEFRNQAGGKITGVGFRLSPFGSFTSVPIITQ